MDPKFMNPGNKKRVPPAPSDSILEQLRDLSGGVGKSVTQDVVRKVASDALASLVGGSSRGELKPNETVKLDRETKEIPAAPPRGVELQPRPVALASEEAKIKQQIEAVRAELKALATSLKSFHQEVEKAILEVPVEPGIYHLNFFERLKSILKVLRSQIEDSTTWLQLWTSRKKKVTYWGLYKKHGTKFGLSAERTLATQAG
ncbi:MAG: DUF5660 family protein [Patescibacteria group bacterium]